ncbi:MAG: CHAT domain-containing protein [Planctomycetes bacterium]|nr:CHAT domain-containing protein [Planctomycetota bacterium]
MADRTGNLQAAHDAFQVVVAYRGTHLTEEHLELQRARMSFGSSKRKLGDLEGALELQEKAYRILSRTLDAVHPDLGWARADLASTKRALGDLKGALELQEKVCEVRSRTLGDDHPDLQWARSDLAGTKSRLGDIKGALELQESVLQVRSRILPEDHPDLQWARADLASTKRVLGDLKGALALQEKVFALRSRTLPDDHPDLGWARADLASTKSRLGDLKGALELQEKVFQVRSKALPDDHQDLQWARVDLASTKFRLGDFKGALELQEKVYEVFSRTLPSDHRRLQMARRNLANTKFLLGDTQAAVHLLEDAHEALSRTLPDEHPYLQEVRENLAAFDADLGRLPAARKLLREAWSGAQKRMSYLGGVLSLRAREEANQGLTDLLSKLLSFRDPQAAPSAADREDLESVLAHRSLLDRQARLGSILARAAERDPELARAIRELQAAQSLFARAYQSTDVEERKRLQELRGETERAEEALTRKVKALPEAEEILLERSLEELAARLPRDGAAVVTAEYTRQFPLEPPFDTESPAGEPAPRKRRDPVASLTAFVVPRDGSVRRVELGEARGIQELAQAWRQALSASLREARGGPAKRRKAAQGREVKEPAGKLLQALQPLLDALPDGTRSLFVCPDGALATVPWDALPLEKAEKAPLLGERFRITYGVSLAALARPRVPEGDPSLLVLGDVDYGAAPEAEIVVAEKQEKQENTAKTQTAYFTRRGGGTEWRNLPESGEEAEDVARLFEENHPRASVERLKGTKASRTYFLSLAHGRRYLHLATHGYIASEKDWQVGEEALRGGLGFAEPARAVAFDRDLLSGIVLAGANLPVRGGEDPAVLLTGEIKGLDLGSCELAVVSACDSNVGPRHLGEAVAGINRGLQLAGARHTITSLWQVEDEGTAELFQAFYGSLWRRASDGRRPSVAEALRQARSRVRERG